MPNLPLFGIFMVEVVVIVDKVFALRASNKYVHYYMPLLIDTACISSSYPIQIIIRSYYIRDPYHLS